MDYFCTIAASNLYILISYCKLFFQVLLSCSGESLQQACQTNSKFSFLLLCFKGVWGIKVSKFVFFRQFNIRFQRLAVSWAYVLSFTTKHSTSCLTVCKNMCGKLPFSYRYHGNNHIIIIISKNVMSYKKVAAR